jgi:hypothetical protein
MTSTITDNPLHHRNRLAWQCRRGMRELDVLLNGFLKRRYARLDCQRTGQLRPAAGISGRRAARMVDGTHDPGRQGCR